MKKFKRIFITVILCLLAAVLLMTFILLKDKSRNSDQFVRRREGLIRLIKQSNELSRIWIEGEDSREWGQVKKQCLKKLGITEAFDESLLRCHPILLDCINEFLVKKSFNIIRSTFSYPNYIYTLGDKAVHEQLDIALSDQCHEIYLEQNIYSYGEAIKNSPDYQFDNFNQHIYIDQHLVTNSEVNEWIKYDKTGMKSEIDGNKLFLPANNLNLTQMQNYCSFKGKQLLQAQYFDAATFLTQDKNRSPFYWTKKRNDLDINCELIFSAECLTRKKWKINSSLPSWAGLYDPLGGVPEVLKNPVDPESNLAASSFYFPKNSPWHRLGFRAHWDGEGNALRNFNFKGLDPEMINDKIQVGFRCMRQVAP